MKRAPGLSGGVARTKEEKHGLDPDQLYDRTGSKPGNQVGDPERAAQLKQMSARLAEDLKQFEHRPFGEFVPGRNATSPDP